VTTDPIDPEEATAARFDPMLRTLLTFGLVVEQSVEDGGPREWVLTPAAQRRLAALSSPTPPPDKLIYFGHRCGSCGENAPTRFSGGAFLCGACRESAAALVQSAVASGG
jgi:hypothetical protein